MFAHTVKLAKMAVDMFPYTTIRDSVDVRTSENVMQKEITEGTDVN